MPKFFYHATDRAGQNKTGTRQAPSEPKLRATLAKEGLTVTELKTLPHVGGKFSIGFLSRVSLVDKLFFTQNLQVMVRTGFSISLAIGTLAKQTKNPKFQTTLFEIKQDVESGVSLSESMRKFPKVFPNLMVNMIAAGELSGQLDKILLRITLQLKKDHNLVSKLRGALIYPIIVVAGMIGIGIFMMIFVIPRITGLFEESGAQLPLATRLLIAISKFTAHYIVFIAIGAVIAVIALNRFLKSASGRRLWHRLLLRTPVISPIVKRIALARFTRGLSSLLASDIPIVDAFGIIASTIGNVHYSSAIEEAAKGLKKGESIVHGLEIKPSLFPPVVTQMIAVGEQSGTLDVVAGEIASFYEEEVDQTLANLSTIIEPVLMIVLGVAVGGMAVAIIMPMYSLVNTF